MKAKIAFIALLFPALSYAQVLGGKSATVIDEPTIRAILNEASGENAYAHTKALSSISRYPISQGFHQAAEYVASEARKLGLQNVQIESFDGDAVGWRLL
jgi:hypothetical protein